MIGVGHSLIIYGNLYMPSQVISPGTGTGSLDDQHIVEDVPALECTRCGLHITGDTYYPCDLTAIEIKLLDSVTGFATRIQPTKCAHEIAEASDTNSQIGWP